MPLTNLDALKVHLGIAATDDSEDDMLSQLIQASEASVKRICGNRQFEKTTYTEYLDGNGSPFIFLKEWPVHSITDLYLDLSGYGGQASGAFAASTELTQGVDFYLVKDPSGVAQSGCVMRINNVWPSSLSRPTGMLSYFRVPIYGCIKVVYIGGFDPVPYDLQLAIWQICAERRLRAKNGQPVQSESDEGYSYSLGGMSDSEAMMIGSVQSLLAPFMPVGRLVS